MRCPISGLECEEAVVRFATGESVTCYQCVEHGEIKFTLMHPAARAKFDAALSQAQAIIAAAKGSEEYGIGG